MRWLLCVLAACGSTTTTAPPPTKSVTTTAPTAEQETARRAELATAHRKLQSEQQDALAAKCEDKTKPAEPRCLPSCYTTEAPDPRAGKKLAGTVAIEHLVCERDGAYVFANELEPKLGMKVVRGRVPKPHKANSWQATIEQALGMNMIVTSNWMTKQKRRCVTVAQYMTLKKPLDACASDGSIGCEALGDAAARGINVVHYRLLEARRLQAAGKTADCQQAALEAVAVARGMPRWRQYAKLNVDDWTARTKYRTRFDGLLDEDTLFATTIGLGQEAEQVFVACGGAAGAPTTVAQEQSFHMCW